MGENLKVMAIAPTPFFSDRGRHVHILEQIKALQKRNVDVILVTYGRGDEIPGITTARTWNFPWYKKVSSGPSWHKIYMDIFLLITTWRVARRIKPDIIHAYTHEGCLIGMIISWLFKRPLVFDHQGSMTKELISHNFFFSRDKVWQSMWFRIEKWLNQQADLIFTQSEKTKQDLINKSDIPPSKISLIYDAVDIYHFKPQKKDTGLMKQYKINKDDLVIVFLGSLYPYQGIEKLLHSWRSIKNRVDNAVLVIMGYPNVHYYKKMAKDLGIIHSVQFTGRVKYEKAPQYLSLGDIAVSPKISEIEDNIKLYNYTACGLPTVAFNTIVNRHILGDLGVYVDVQDDPHTLANTIVELLKDKVKRENLAKELRKKAIKMHGWSNIAKQIINKYRQLLK